MLHAHQEIMKRLLTYFDFLKRTGPALKLHWKCLREPGRSVGFGFCCSHGREGGACLNSYWKKGCVCVLHCSVMSSSLWSHGLRPTRVLCPWNFTGKNTGVGYLFLLQVISLTLGSNGISYVSCIGRWILYHWHHLGSLSWGLHSFSFPPVTWVWANPERQWRTGKPGIV